MCIKEIERQLKEACKSVMQETDYKRVDRLVFDQYDPETQTLMLLAKDATEALFVSRCYSHVLVEELERIVGTPANIVCKYKATSSTPHERFTIQRDA